MESMEASRQVMWMIPFWMKALMYASLVPATYFFIQGLIPKYKFVVGDKNPKDILPKQLNIKSFLTTIFYQGKVPRDGFVNVFHSMIFWGFITLFIATELVAIHADTPFKVFTGTTYKVVSFLADVGGIFVLLGIGLAYYRRYVQKKQFLSATRPNQEKFMYGMLIALVVIGYFLEAIRIYVTNMPEGERFWSPIGYTFAAVIGSLGLSQEFLAGTYKTLWLGHMLNTMAFVATLTNTKFFHILIIPFNALLTPPRRGAVLMPMDFANENAETFGLGKTSELTMKMKLDTLACVECGRCTQVCPANLADKPLDPKLIITKMRDVMDYNVDGE